MKAVGAEAVAHPDRGQRAGGEVEGGLPSSPGQLPLHFDLAQSAVPQLALGQVCVGEQVTHGLDRTQPCERVGKVTPRGGCVRPVQASRYGDHV